MKKLLAVPLILLSIFFLITAEESLAVGGKDKESKIARSSSYRKSVTMVSISHNDEDVATSHGVALLEGSENSEDLEELQNVFQTLILRDPTSKVISPNFLITLGALNEEERESEKLGPKTKKAIKVLSAVSAICISSVEAVLAMTEYNLFTAAVVSPSASWETMESLTFGQYGYTWSFGVPIAVFSLVKNYGASKEFMEWVFMENSSYRGFSLSYNNSNIIFASILAIAIGFKPFFTLFDLFTLGREFEEVNYTSQANLLFEVPSIMHLFIVASIFWANNTAREAYFGARNSIVSCTRSVDCCLKKQPKHVQFSRKTKEKISEDLSAGFRRLLKEPEAGNHLAQQVHNFEKFIEKETESFDRAIVTLRLQDFEESSKRQEEIREILDKKLLYQHLSNFLIVRALVNFSREGLEDYHIDLNYEDSKCPILSRAFNNKHPCWYNTLYTVGRLIGFLTSLSVWYGSVYAVSEAFDTDIYASCVMGSIIGSFLIFRLIEDTGTAFANIVSRCANYNPIQGEKYVSKATEHLNYNCGNKACRSTADCCSCMPVGSMIRSPSMLLGPIAMLEGIGAEKSLSLALADPILFNYILLSSMPVIALSFASSERNQMEGHIQGLITEVGNCCGKSSHHKKQNLASLYKKVDTWIAGLRLGFIEDLDRYLKIDLENLSSDMESAREESKED